VAEKTLKEYIREKEFNYALGACEQVACKLRDDANDDEAAAFVESITAQIREFMDKNNINNILGR
jgi:hypothetical protein